MSEKRQRTWMAIWWTILILWSVIAVMYLVLTRPTNGEDFGVYYAAAESLRFSPHSDIYSLPTLAQTVSAHGGCAPAGDWPWPYLYQPLLAILLEPLTFLPCQNASTVWLVFNLGLWIGVAGAYALNAWQRQSAIRILLVSMITMFFAPILSGIQYGQIHLLLLGSIVLGVMLIESEHEYLGGAILGFGLILKYFPAFIVLYYVLRGRWRISVSAATSSALLVLLEALVVGPDRVIEAVRMGEASVRQFATIYESGYWMKPIFGSELPAYIACAVFVTVVLWFRWFRHSQSVNDTLGAGWAIVTALIISPLVWWHETTWALPALIACFDALVVCEAFTGLLGNVKSKASRWWPFAMLVVSYALLTLFPYGILRFVPDYFTMAAGMLILWLLCGTLYLWSAGVRLPRPLVITSWRQMRRAILQTWMVRK